MRAAWLALWLGGLLTLFFDCNGSNNISPPQEPGPSDSSAEPPAAPEPWAAAFDLDPDGLDSLERLAGLEDLGLALTIGLVVIALLFWVVFFLVRCFIRTGWIRLHDHVLRTGTQAFKPLFSGADRMVAMILHRLLGGAIELAAVLPLLGVAVLIVEASIEKSALLWGAGCVTGLLSLFVMAYVWLGTSLGPWALVLDGLGPTAALKKSWSLAAGNRLALFLYYFISTLFSLGAAIAGIIACCVGLVATLPGAQAMVDLGRTQAYLLVTRGSGVRDQWRLFDRAVGATPSEAALAPMSGPS